MELLVRLIDRSDREDDSKRGDVVVAMPDGWAWSEAERMNSAWIIIKVVSLLGTDLDAMLAASVDATGRLHRRRGWKLDLSVAALPQRFNYPRKTESVTMLRAAVAAMLVRKPALQ